MSREVEYWQEISKQNMFSVPLSNISCILYILPNCEIDGPGRAPKIRPAVLPSHGLNKNSDDRGVALEVARSSVSG